MQERKIIGYEEARVALDTIHDHVLKEVSEGKEQTVVSAAVLDANGDIVAVMRMEGAAARTLYIAIKKGKSAAINARDTREHQEFYKKTGWRQADFVGDYTTTVPGGIIITEPGVSRERKAGGKGPTVYGGIGISGRTADGDEELAFIGMHGLQKAVWGKSDA